MTKEIGPLGQRISAELRAELARKRMSGRDLAKTINAPQNTVNRWLAGDTYPNLDALDAMCRALGLSVADLLAAVERNGGYQPAVSLRRRASPVIGAADNSQASGGDTHRLLAQPVAA